MWLSNQQSHFCVYITDRLTDIADGRIPNVSHLSRAYDIKLPRLRITVRNLTPIHYLVFEHLVHGVGKDKDKR